MKIKSKVLMPVMTLTLLLGALTSCGKTNNSNNVTSNGVTSNSGGGHEKPRTLSIMFYNGGYGDEWVEEIVDEYMQLTGDIVEATPDKTISNKAEQQLNSKNAPEYDIFISHDLNWQNYADRGLIATLDDLYESETFDGDKFEDRVLPEAKNLSKYKAVNDNEEHYYKVCLTQGAGGFVYNEDMFEEHGWAVPTTYDELVSLCAEIVKTDIVPFAWAGGGETRDYYWDYPIFEWWAEMDGLEAINAWAELKGADGTYKNGFDNFDPNGKAKNFKKAYEMWHSLVAMNTKYSNTDAQGAQLITAQQLFYNEQAAMIPYGQWAKYEIEAANGGSFGFNARMMKTPRVSADDDYYNFMVGFGDSMIVAKKSPNLEAAKDFLKFMATKQACKAFVEKAEGPFLAFNYDDVDLKDIRAKDSYVDSMYKILTECHNFSLASNSPIIVANGTTEIQPWIANVRYYKEAMANPSGNTADIVFEKVYNSARNSWSRYCRAAGVN